MMKPDIDQCIKCSICSVYCPVLKATGLFPGPKLAGPDAERFRRRGKNIPAKWLEYCDYCKICEKVCPHNVPVSEIHLQARRSSGKAGKPSLRDRLLGNSYLLEKIGSLGAPISNWFFQWSFLRWLLDRGLGIDRRMKMPSFRRKTFKKWFQSHLSGHGEAIAYFYGCYTNYVDPETGKAVVAVMEKNGFRVILPRQQCCGLPLMGNSFFDLASRLGIENIKSLGKVVEEGMDILYSSPSCGMMIQKEYAGILNLPGASSLEPHLWEVFQFLLRLHEEGRLNTSFKELKGTYYYHAPCHLRALQIGLPALELLSLIPGLKIRELPEACCGLAGSYGFKREKYAIAEEVGQEIFQAVRRLKAEIVISECEACRMQIGQKTGVKTLHPIQILYQAYGE
jgi:glycerol-3-phosphate dehydrogenase subunit C